MTQTIYTFTNPRDRELFLEALIREECRRDIAMRKGLDKLLKKIKEVIPNESNRNSAQG